MAIQKRKRPELPDEVLAPWYARGKTGTPARQGDVYVWPPVVIGKEDVDSIVLNEARCVIRDEGLGEEQFSIVQIGGGSQKLLVFAPTAKGVLAAHVLGEVCNQDIYRQATVSDMTAIDPHKKFVRWTSLIGDIERALNPDAVQEKALQEKYKRGEMKDQFQHLQPRTLSPSPQEELVQHLSELISLDHSKFPPRDSCGERLGTYLQIRDKLQDHEEKVSTFLMRSCEREAIMKDIFAVDYARVTKHTLGKVKELGVFPRGVNSGDENGHQFFSKVMEKPMEMERKTLSLLVKDIEEKEILDWELNQKCKSDVDLTLQLLDRQHEALMMHLRACIAAKERRLENRLQSKLHLVTHIRTTQEKTSKFKRFFSTDVAKVAQEVYSVALTELHNKVATMTEGKANVAECIICFGALEEANSSRSAVITPEAAPHSKKLKRACFSPCMHASVCTTCAHRIWDTGPQVCPVCKEKLFEKPKPIFL